MREELAEGSRAGSRVSVAIDVNGRGLSAGFKRGLKAGLDAIGACGSPVGAGRSAASFRCGSLGGMGSEGSVSGARTAGAAASWAGAFCPSADAAAGASSRGATGVESPTGTAV
jgi:hypothetical protein